MNIILCGPPAVGKSALGQALADHLHCSFVDTDQLLENPRQIYLEDGETGLRAKEGEILKRLLNQSLKGAVISTGGGIIHSPVNRALLKQLGKVVFLSAHPFTLFDRLCERGLPAYLNPEAPFLNFIQLLCFRYPLYKEIATLQLKTDQLTLKKQIQKLAQIYG